MTVVMGLILRSLLVFALGAAPAEKVPVAQVEGEVHQLINAERSKAGIKKMKLDDELSDVARAHSRDMAARDFFSHVNPEGQTPTQRGLAADYTCRVVRGQYARTGLAENIYGTKAYRRVLYRPGPIPYYEMRTAEELATAAVQAWMASPGHRENILRDGIQRTGIGVAVASDDRVLITQLFC